MEEAGDAAALRSHLEAKPLILQGTTMWAVLGFSALDGPEPTREWIEQRRGEADKLIQHFAKDAFHADCQAMLTKVHSACAQCLEGFADMRRPVHASRELPATPHTGWNSLALCSNSLLHSVRPGAPAYQCSPFSLAISSRPP